MAIIVTQSAAIASAASYGDGTMTVSPGNTTTGSNLNSFIFNFTWDNNFKSGSQATILVPLGWTAPQLSNPTNPGYVSVAKGPASACNAANLDSITATGPWNIVINMDCDNNEKFTVTYAGNGTKVTAPNAAGTYTFTTKTKQNGGSPKNISTHPFITVNNNPLPNITSISPAIRIIGSATFTMTVTGTNFVSPSSVVRLEGTNRTTTYVNSTSLNVSILASDQITAGTFNITVFNPTPGGGSSNAQILTVNKAVPTITWSNPSDIYYGNPLSGTQLDATASVAGSLVYTPPVGTLMSGGDGQALHVDFTPTDSNNYTVASKDVIINVRPEIPMITWSNPANITYGTLLSGTQLNAIASVPGDFTYTPLSGTILDAGAGQTIMADFTPLDSTNYTGVSKGVFINVTRATPLITWENPADITSGTALDSTQLDATASVPGSFTYDPASGTVMAAGAGQTLHVDFMPTDSNNYSVASKVVAINVMQEIPIITWSDPADISYGTPLDATQLDAIASVPGVFTYTPLPGTVLGAGAGQTLTADFTPLDSINYTGASKAVVINVTSVTPIISWENPADITYGTALDATQLDATTSVPGSFTYDPASGTVLAAGSGQTLHVDFAPLDSENYTPASGSVMINVTQATYSINWNNPENISYGTPLGATQLNATASVPGEFIYTPPSGTVLVEGAGQILFADFMPADSTNYTGTSKVIRTVNVISNAQACAITAPADILTEATGSLTDVNIGNAITSNCSAPETVTNDAPEAGFPVGTRIVTWTVTDSNEATASDTQKVTISEQTSRPVPPVPELSTIVLTSAGILGLFLIAGRNRR
jgi:hypothetical protein